jgi:8-oxo-dGTP pyrophosphatase MutT (NUDIX family)
MSERNRWCLGFCFSERLVWVALILKKHGPQHLIGKWNGIGGSLKKGETPLVGMVREFKEETGVRVPEWNPFGELRTDSGDVFLFSSRSKLVQKIETKTDEPVRLDSIALLPHSRSDYVPNLNWLVEMALAREQGIDRCKYFIIQES